MNFRIEPNGDFVISGLVPVGGKCYLVHGGRIRETEVERIDLDLSTGNPVSARYKLAGIRKLVDSDLVSSRSEDLLEALIDRAESVAEGCAPPPDEYGGPYKGNEEE